MNLNFKLLSLAIIVSVGSFFKTFTEDLSDIKFSNNRVKAAKLKIKNFVEGKKKRKKTLAIATGATVTTLLAYTWYKGLGEQNNLSPEVRDKLLIIAQDKEKEKSKISDQSKAYIPSSLFLSLGTSANNNSTKITKNKYGILKSWVKASPKRLLSFSKELGFNSFSAFKSILGLGIAEFTLSNIGFLKFLENLVIIPDLLWFVKNRTLLDLKIIDIQYLQNRFGNLESNSKSMSLDQSNIESALFYGNSVYSGFIEDIAKSETKELCTKVAIRDIETLCGYMKYKIETIKLDNILNQSFIAYANQIVDSLKNIANSLVDLLENQSDIEVNTQAYLDSSKEVAKLIVKFCSMENKFN